MRTMQGAELINSTTMGSLKKIANLVKVLVDRVLIGLKMVEQLIEPVELHQDHFRTVITMAILAKSGILV